METHALLCLYILQHDSCGFTASDYSKCMPSSWRAETSPAFSHGSKSCSFRYSLLLSARFKRSLTEQLWSCSFLHCGKSFTQGRYSWDTNVCWGGIHCLNQVSLPTLSFPQPNFMFKLDRLQKPIWAEAKSVYNWVQHKVVSSFSSHPK